jgi:hypothetical protein
MWWCRFEDLTVSVSMHPADVARRRAALRAQALSRPSHSAAVSTASLGAAAAVQGGGTVKRLLDRARIRLGATPAHMDAAAARAITEDREVADYVCALHDAGEQEDAGRWWVGVLGVDGLHGEGVLGTFVHFGAWEWKGGTNVCFRGRSCFCPLC